MIAAERCRWHRRLRTPIRTTRSISPSCSPRLPPPFGRGEQYWKYNHSRESFFRAGILVWGRGFDASARDPDMPERRVWIMVPLIDMVNHQSFVAGYFSDLSNLGEHTFSTWSTECVAEGGEVS